MSLDNMITESINQSSMDIDKRTVPEILKIMNDNDKQVAFAVEKVLPEIAEAVNMIAKALKNSGRLFYIGAGTSGRLGVVDAAECPPTFGVSHSLVQAIVSGGKEAVFKAREGCEDNERTGGRELMKRKLTRKDVVVGLSTSGRTPYVWGALKKAKETGASTVALICNPQGRVTEYADIVICPVVGPEVIMGSTRLKAGTSEKMILNMLSTAVMIKLGKVTGNMMTDMQLSCSKLRERAKNMIMLSTGLDENAAESLLQKNDFNVKKALFEAGKNN